MASLAHGGRTAGSGKHGGACPTVRGQFSQEGVSPQALLQLRAVWHLSGREHCAERLACMGL